MKVTPNPDKAAEMLAEAAGRRVHQRSAGIHVSDLIVCLKQAYYNRTVGTPASREASVNLTHMLGEAFHLWLQYEDEKPVAWLGMTGSPDYLESIDADGPPSPIEIKSTRSSAKKGPTEMGHYLDQLASYCLMLGTNRGRLAILHMNGDYGANRMPIFVVWDIEFTDEEMTRWQGRLLHRRELLEQALDLENPHLLNGQHLQWPCQYCPYKGLVCPGEKGAWGLNFTEGPGDF